MQCKFNCNNNNNFISSLFSLCTENELKSRGGGFGGSNRNFGHNKSSGNGSNNNNNNSGIAIVVILQGDSWEWGSGNIIDGSALASFGQVMVVTLNYRLGVLGKLIFFTYTIKGV